ncbi:acriflavine resistance protein B [Niastella yeongjuensis]|uniref:Acriflavine resistance protein B n=1 Tax=Niastella yeongjuensis TaxID=354355 RepID=A0A1V9EA35_9BACT|nr:efflux RND transporter permease subunit [Niastella yeongjuensis]OQP42959.1 acriflavine resistance protein B [Niastella yeongjuensis]SEO60959.1 heavy metal efflux pump, CzcA family [Niastella yeongjuensis]
MNNFFLTHKNPLTVLLVLILGGGIFVYTKLQTSLFPEITFPKIKVIADAGLQPVDKMMVTVTKPLEGAIKQVPDLQMIRSTTSRGSCEISAFMDWNANIDLSQQRIESKIAEIRNQLPPEVQISVARMNPSILPVMGYSLESNTKSPIELKQIANFTVKPFLSQVAGVSEIRITGGKAKEYWLQLNIQKMGTFSITPDMVNTALSQTNFIKSNGYLSDYHYLYLTVTDATVHNKNELEQIVIKNDGKRIITVKDIADVQINEGVEFVKINANGRDGVLVAVVKQPNANLVTLSKAMEKKISELKKILPPDVRIIPYYIQADFVNDSIKSVTDSLWIGLLLAIVVAIIFLRSLKASATLLFTIPITLGLTLIVLYAVGYTFNIMTLGAIAAAVGLIIDDAIVVVEQIHRTHEEHPEEPSTTLVQKAIHYLFPAMLGSSISTIVIFIPFLLMSGVAGAYFSVMTNTMIITLVCSFFVTWIGLPVVYLLLTKDKPRSGQQAAVHNVRSQNWVSFFIKRPYLSIAFVVALAVLIALLVPRLETGFLPEMDEGSIVLDYNSPPGTSLEETDRELRQVEKILKAIPEVQAYSRRTGAQMGFFITEPNRGDYLIQLKKSRKRGTEDVITDIRKQIEGSQPALRVDFGQVIGDMLGDLMTSVQPIEIKIYGNDQKTLQQLSKQVANVVSNVSGTADVFDGVVIAGPSISVQPDYAKLAQFGITPANFQYQLQTSLEGNISGSLFEKQQYVPIRLVYPGNRKMSVSNIDDLKIFLPDGRLKPLTALATVKVNGGDAEIERENLQSMGVVTARLENRDLGSVMKDIQQKLAAGIHLPQSYSIQYGGAYADQQQSFKELLMILVTASLLVFAVILFLYRSFSIALLILGIAVLGISGSYLALFLTGTPLNVGSYTGLIMITGIIGENSVFTFLQFRESLHEKNTDEAIIYSISTRLRPKLMTALGAIIALMPLALGIGTGAQLHQPLAIAVIGGFIMALPLLLIVLPTGIRMIYKNKTTTT